MTSSTTSKTSTLSAANLSSMSLLIATAVTSSLHTWRVHMNEAHFSSISLSADESSILTASKYLVPAGWEVRITEANRVFLPILDSLRQTIPISKEEWCMSLIILDKNSGYTKGEELTASENSFKDGFLKFKVGAQYTKREDFFLLLCNLFAYPVNRANSIFCKVSKRKIDSARRTQFRLERENIEKESPLACYGNCSVASPTTYNYLIRLFFYGYRILFLFQIMMIIILL